MDQLSNYRKFVRKIFEEYASYNPAYGDVEMELIVDPTHDHFQLMSVGWKNQQRIHGCVLHVDIKDGKIWIQHDGTEEGIANRLVEWGVPKSDIVLAFHSPFKRKFTEYAVG
ncbi:MAG TPA: XisI protein [Planctomycetota bacterium]|nr:XisI protein [Planctomycetota bacterium]